MPEKNELKSEQEKRQFINEKIIRPRLSRGQIARRLLFCGFSALLFGFLAAVTFVVSEPLAKKYLIKETEESSSISIPKDEPETEAEPETTKKQVETETETETEPIEDVIRDEVERYQFTLEDLVKMYDSFNALFQETDKGIVTVQSVKTQMDWFNNPIEMASLYSGVIIAATEEEYLILVPIGAVQEADLLEITLPGGTQLPGQLKGTDQVLNIAVISMAAEALDEEMKEQIKVLELGNSYSVRQGELVFAGGSPAGITHSISMGCISYVARNVPVVDGVSRLFYTDTDQDAGAGTFLFNTKGQIIGWATDEYRSENNPRTVVRALSDYKGILEDLSNGIPAPYFGIIGLEVTEEERQGGLPLGIYVSSALAEGPAYQAGIQNGDIITRIGETPIITMKDFQGCLDSLSAESVVVVEVQRYGQEAYTPIEYEVTIGAR